MLPIKYSLQTGKALKTEKALFYYRENLSAILLGEINIIEIR